DTGDGPDGHGREADAGGPRSLSRHDRVPRPGGETGDRDVGRPGGQGVDQVLRPGTLGAPAMRGVKALALLLIGLAAIVPEPVRAQPGGELTVDDLVTRALA